MILLQQHIGDYLVVKRRDQTNGPYQIRMFGRAGDMIRCFNTSFPQVAQRQYDLFLAEAKDRREKEHANQIAQRTPTD